MYAPGSIPKSSIPIKVQASGVLVAPANTATKPAPASSPTGKGTTADNALPNVAPMKNSGVTSPPLKPDDKVTVVKRIFTKNT